MTYQILNTTIPQNKRKEINEKIIHIIENNLTTKYNVSTQDVFSSYTGDGHLHGLSFNDYDSFHEYTKAKQQIETGQFYTPYELTRFLSIALNPSIHDIIGDITSGHGAFLNWLPCKENIYTNEIDVKSFKVQKFLYPSVNATLGDIREYSPLTRFDLIIGNPPYNLDGFQWEGKKVSSQMFYCLKAADLLKPSALFCIVVPESFLSDEFSNKTDIEMINHRFNALLQLNLPNDTFKNVGVSNFKTKVLFMQRKSEHITESPYNSQPILDLREFSLITANTIHSQYIQPILEQKEKLKAKLYFENVGVIDNTKEEQEFQFKIDKLLFDIKRSNKTSIHYAKCTETIHRFRTQLKPEGMSVPEWMEIRLTKEKVLLYLKSIIKNQHIKEISRISLVKTNYGLRMKGYSQKDRDYLSKFTGVKEMSFNDMILNDIYPFEDQSYKKLLNRKNEAYNRQSKKFQDAQKNSCISEWLNDFKLLDEQNERVIELNAIQKEDIGKVLQKRSSLLQWDCGGGKSLAAIAYAQYRLKHNNIRNMFIVAPAIAIAGTFEPSLTNFKIPFFKIDSLKSIANIKNGDIVLITLNMLVKYQKQIKKFIKLKANKIGLILDESDSIANVSSKRAKATINVFQTVKFKLLTTGTSVRNSIGEAFPQFNLMFNASINMINHCEYTYVQDNKTKELVTKHNEYYMKPFPQYTKGQKLFQESHIPEKITVFGASSNSQHIYNKDVLKNMIDSTIITRTFEEITGRSIATILQDTCKFNNHEKALYKRIIDEFYEMARNIYKTGNPRKDAMLQIIQQLNMLIRSCSASHLFDEYTGSGYSSKFAKVFSMIKKWDNEPVVIGCRFKKTVYSYANHIRAQFPDRKLFVVTGEDMTLKQRKEMVVEMKKEKNPILVCTQQSLSSSISINYVNKIIVAELSWNGASLHQFTARFVRFDSESDNKEIHYVTYENSIENNLLRLILSKEALNLYMKSDYINNEELFDRFGVDANIFNMLMTKEKTEDGYSRIKWGEQNIV
ncbi:helicase-related protein [Paenibacillus sp. N1-5-1-14]|uniref:helicase-related protein n=1 Tax=Paenibacillus radicibacter TaxID=2972488 RepID=UPI002158D8DF|nr:helicase-related protein [Paenibacillus radicibacter]MCR8641513.1 helicase-related protein [Paenibacillus radicibacter]